MVFREKKIVKNLSIKVEKKFSPPHVKILNDEYDVYGL